MIEEERAAKRIAETRRRAKEIMELKQWRIWSRTQQMSPFCTSALGEANVPRAKSAPCPLLVHLFVLRRRNTAHISAQNEAGEWMNSEMELQRQLMQQTRNERQEAISASRAAVAQMRKGEVAMLKQMKRENEEAAAVQRNMDHARAVARKQHVKVQQQQAKDRKSRERELALAKLRKEREEKRQQARRTASRRAKSLLFSPHPSSHAR